MKYFIIETLMVSLPVNPLAPVVITLPNNIIPIGIEVRPAGFPQGLFIHHLIPCDENGNIMEEVVAAKNIYEVAWEKLSQVYGEQQNQEGLDIMGSTLKGVQLEREGEISGRV